MNDTDMKLETEIHQKQFRSAAHKAGVNLIYTFNWYMSQHGAAFLGEELTMQQYNVLRILRGQHPNPASVKLIRERMLDKMSDASRIVERLRQKGFVTRKECPTDRRNVDITITESGLAKLACLDAKTEQMEKIFATLTELEIETLNGLLDKLRG
jgi:DNA-binding MarR family transcriptional regulator